MFTTDSPKLSADRLRRVAQGSREPRVAGDIAPDHLMMGLGSHVAVSRLGGVGWKVGCVQKMVRVRKEANKRTSRTSYIYPVSLVSKPSGVAVSCNWFQSATGGRLKFSYTESGIIAVPISSVIRKVRMVQQGRTTKWELDAGDYAYLNGGDWRSPE